MLVTLSSALRRRTLYYFSNLIGPCVLIARWRQMWSLVIALSSIFSTPIWMLVILAWLFLVSIFLLTLEKRYLVKDFIKECKTWSQSNKVLLFISRLLWRLQFLCLWPSSWTWCEKKSTKVSNLTKLSQVSDMQPPSSETPLIGTYFSCIMIMVGCHVLLDGGRCFF